MSIKEWFGPPYTPKRLGLVFSATVSFLGLITYTSNAIPEGSWPATRGWVREHTHQTRSSQISIELRIEESEHRRIKQRLDDLNIEIQKNPNATEGLRRILEEQIENSKSLLEEKIETLRKLREQQRRFLRP